MALSETCWKNASSASREVVSVVVNDAWMSVKVVLVLVNKAVRAVSIPSCIYQNKMSVMNGFAGNRSALVM